MAFSFFREDTNMNPRRFEFEAGAAPVNSQTRRQAEETVQAAMRAADVKRDDLQSDQPIEEPGYGHGV